MSAASQTGDKQVVCFKTLCFQRQSMASDKPLTKTTDRILFRDYPSILSFHSLTRNHLFSLSL